MHTMLL